MKRILLLAACLAHALAHGAPAVPLERLFEEGRYAEFLAAARPLASQGDTQAQFLLGQAYRFGKGVTKDKTRAEAFYKKAAAADHAGAWNDLGEMITEGGVPGYAIEYYERAVALGLGKKAQRNLLKAQTITCTSGSDLDPCFVTAAAAERLWREDRDLEMLDVAVEVYANACTASQDQAMRLSRGACGLAMSLGDEAVKLGLGKAAHYMATVDEFFTRYEQAASLYRIGADRGVGAAATALGNLYSGGRLGENGEEQAMVWYRRGAELGDSTSFDRVKWNVLASIREMSDPAKIRTAMAELAALAPNDQPDENMLKHLALAELFVRHAQIGASLSKASLERRFCPKPAYDNFEKGMEWRIVSAPDPVQTRASDSLPQLASGTADAKACIVLGEKAVDGLHAALAKGATPMLIWPGQRCVLALTRTKSGKWQLKADQMIH